LVARRLFATLVARSVSIGFVAVTSMYESLLFLSAALCATLFVLRVARPARGMPPSVLFGATMVCLVLLLVSSSPLFPSGIQPPVPIIRSFWLVLHVIFTFIGEAFFVVSFVAAICSLAARDAEGRADMDRLTATAVGIGYPVFTAGALVFGAIWAEVAWGSWWSWDPKETWALITWLIYTAYLHTRLVRKMRGPLAAWIAIAGFAATVFTFFGVTFLLPGLHSYG
jgi:ABC-type transport system involved in cytochrome c biogenesis permease subunit